jgi:hypothetical protein
MQAAKYLNQLAEAEKTAHMGSCEIDLTTGNTVWSDEFYRICGLEPKTTNPNTARSRELIHPDDREKVAAAVEKTLLNGEKFDLEKRIITYLYHPNLRKPVFMPHSAFCQFVMGTTVLFRFRCV